MAAMKRPASAIPASAEEGVMKRPAAKAKAKGQSKAFIDWAKADSEAAGESAGTGSGTRIRSKRQVVVAGQDSSGAALPTDDSSGYSRAQKYVFEKAKSRLDEAFVESYESAVQSQNRAEQCRLINSIVPKEAGFNYDIDLGSSAAQMWQKRVTGFQEEKRKQQLVGYSTTEIVAKLGSKAALQEGLQAGDIKEEGGFFFFERRCYTKTQGKKESSSASWSGELADDKLADFLKAITSYTTNTQFLTWAKEPPTKLKMVKASAESASETGYKNLQEAFGALSMCSREVQKGCRGFPRDALSPTVKGLIGRAMELDSQVHGHLQKMQALLTNLDGSTTDDTIRVALNESLSDFSKLAEAEKELKSLSKASKSKGSKE